MTDLPPPGWHPDPGDPTMLRWWDGTQWTEHQHPAAPPWVAGAPGGAGAGADAGGGPSATASGGVAPGQQAPPYGLPGPYGYGGGSQGGWGGGGAQWGGGGGTSGQQGWGSTPGGYTGRPIGRSARSDLWASNRFSFVAIGFGVLYIALALSTGFVLLGIVPAVSAGRAWQRGEKLAPVAVIAAVAAIVSAIFILVHRHR